MGLRRNKGPEQKPEEVIDNVRLDKLPNFVELKSKVDEMIAQSSWWELYGFDWFVAIAPLAFYPLALFLLGSSSLMNQATGVALYGFLHATLTTKTGHAVAHGQLTQSNKMNRVLTTFYVEFLGQFSESMTYDIHIRVHHPHTNIIGLGDSSTWKVPFLPKYTYMFVAPLLTPAVIIVLSIAGLIEKRSFLGLIKYFIIGGSGLAIQIYMLVNVSGFSILGAFCCLFLVRSLFAIPWIHVNIFQHIGLPMYSQENRPKRIYQMATGVLNLPRNPLLDFSFGHSIVSCHVEHHLFPRLSDNMCLKIKPLVASFLKEGGLPYNEDTYMSKLGFFLDKYEALMVNAPPITHFFGLQ